jgi:hypothetical protein
VEKAFVVYETHIALDFGHCCRATEDASAIWVEFWLVLIAGLLLLLLLERLVAGESHCIEGSRSWVGHRYSLVKQLSLRNILKENPGKIFVRLC